MSNVHMARWNAANAQYQADDSVKHIRYGFTMYKPSLFAKLYHLHRWFVANGALISKDMLIDFWDIVVAYTQPLPLAYLTYGRNPATFPTDYQLLSIQ